jgi:ribonuclease D
MSNNKNHKCNSSQMEELCRNILNDDKFIVTNELIIQMSKYILNEPIKLDYIKNGFSKHDSVKENLIEFYKQVNDDKKIEVVSSVHKDYHCIDVIVSYGEDSLTVLSRYAIYNQEQLDFVLNNCSRFK